MKLTYHGHACFTVAAGGQHLLFDPFITGNELAKGKVDPDQLPASHLLISHGHGDHLADAQRIAERTGAKLIAPFEVGEWFEQKGVKNVEAMNHGGSLETAFGRVKLTAAVHSSALPDGTYGGNPCGFLCQTGEGAFYYSGDTALTRDLELIPHWAPQLAFAVFPIGGYYTMDVDDALLAAAMVGAKTIVGVHYNTFPPIRIDPAAALGKAEKAGVRLLLPGIGETIDFAEQ